MKYENKIATVFGGTGFVGTQVVRELAALGMRVKVATRVPERAYFLRPCGVVGQVVPFACDYSDAASIRDAVQDADFVVNCVAVLYERRRSTFQKAHVDIASMIAQACAERGTQRLVHLSALGIEGSQSKYAKTKLEGERVVVEQFAAATILRPSVIFGEDDEFFNKFAKLAKIMPFLPLIGGGKTMFQPVYVGDVADAVIAALSLPDVADVNPLGRIYELGGPEVVSFKEIYERLFVYTNSPRKLINLGFGLVKFQAFFMKLLPKPLLTPDQVENLKTDSVVSVDAFGFEALGIRPMAMEMILPQYLSRYRPGGRFGPKNDQKADEQDQSCKAA